MLGRKPKTAAQQIAEGDPRKRGVHKLDARLAAEPKAEKGLPPCPSRLRGRARELWAIWSEDLENMGLDHRPDAEMLQGACVMAARAEEADDSVMEDGLMIVEPVMASRVVRTGDGVEREKEQVGTITRPNPALAISDKAWGKVIKFCSEFGLSPVSRTRLTVEKKDDGEKELMAMLSKPRAAKDAVQ